MDEEKKEKDEGADLAPPGSENTGVPDAPVPPDLSEKKETAVEAPADFSTGRAPSVRAGGSVFDIVKNLEVQLDAAYAMKEALERDLGDSEDARRDLERELRDLRARLTVLEERSRQADELEEELAFTENERTISSEKAQSLERQLIVLQGAKEMLDDENANLKGEVADLADRVASLEAELATTAQTRDRLKDELGRANGQIEE
ncbi:MAG: hypothetical protein ACYS8W_21865, partial [Planctomycetota bacterium]